MAIDVLKAALKHAKKIHEDVKYLKIGLNHIDERIRKIILEIEKHIEELHGTRKEYGDGEKVKIAHKE